MRTHYGEEDTTYSSKAVNGTLAPVFERSGLRAPRSAYQTTFLGQGSGRGPNIAGANSFRYAGGNDNGDMLGAGAGELGGLANYGNGYGGPANLDASDIAASDPYSPEKSPVLWACVFLVVGLLGLRYVHWRG